MQDTEDRLFTAPEELLDVKNGRLQPWREHKVESQDLAKSLARIGKNSKAQRVWKCGRWLSFKRYTDETMKLHRASFCKTRLCAMCAWRRSLKIFGQVSKVMNYLTAENEYRYIFLTLTVKNVAGDALADELDGMFRAFKNMTARKEFKRIAKGWFRCLEVTHKWERNDYHPHFHAVIAVNKSYFTEASMYLSQKDWAALWQSCMGIDYEPVVDVRSVQPKQGTSNDYSKAVAEVAKYAVKSGDYIKRDEYSDVIIEDSTDEAVEILDDALHNRRLVAFGGCFKDAHKLLNLDDIEKGDLVNTDNDELRTDLSYVVVTYGWSVGLGTYRRKKGIFVE